MISLRMLTSLQPTDLAQTTAVLLCIGYGLIEVFFFIHYHWKLFPRANHKRISVPPAPYRDYIELSDRATLLTRILDRLSNRVINRRAAANYCEGMNRDNEVTDMTDVCYKFIESWFLKKDQNETFDRFSEQLDKVTLDAGLCPPAPLAIRLIWSSLRQRERNAFFERESSFLHTIRTRGARDDVKSEKGKKGNLFPNKLQKENVDEFFSWAFFGLHHSYVKSNLSMQVELEKMYEVIKKKAGLTFEPGRNPDFTPRCFTLEEINSLYRPFVVYAGVALMRFIANCTLYLIGFRRYSCERGLNYWYYPPKRNDSGASSDRRFSHQRNAPFLFFHGIAPGGHSPYVPLITYLLMFDRNKTRDVFIFENKPISYALCFEALSEEDTVHGILEAINKHLEPSCIANNLILCGHSLGSCQLSWVVSSPQLRGRIRSLILLDPVAILLSEPDVMINFLYKRRQEGELDLGNSNNGVKRMTRILNEAKIRLVASSELFIEYYLRRNFAWYNSELWLGDIPRNVKVVVCLSELDEIVNSPKVLREIKQHNCKIIDANKKHFMEEGSGNAELMGPIIDVIYWKGVGHANCVINPDRWASIRKALNAI